MSRDDLPQTEMRPERPAAGNALEAGNQIGDFRIERRLGAGGMGIVYQARQVSLNRLVALKVLGRALTRDADLARFRREAQAAARLRHPSIAQVYYVGQDRHICYLAMELIEGASLRRVLDCLQTTDTPETSLDSVVHDELGSEPDAQALRFDEETETHHGNGEVVESQSPTSTATQVSRELRSAQRHIRRVCEVVRDAASALAHAHQQQVVHRDIKPDNLLLDRQGQTHIIDFGIARFFDDQSITFTGQLVGTPMYMSPEQITGRGAVDARTDIYSLGLVLYELLTLAPPITASNRENLLRAIVTKPLPPVSWRNAAVPHSLERIVHRATQKDPDLRYASAAEFAADLERFLSGQSVMAPPYHYRLDEREIIAARPSRVMAAAIGLFIAAFTFFTIDVAIGVMTAIMFWTNGDLGIGVPLFTIALGLAVLAAGIVIGRGVLRAKSWARWMGLLAAGIAAPLAAAGVAWLIFLSFSTEPASAPKTDGTANATQFNFIGAIYAFYAVPALMVLTLGLTTLWGLLGRATGEWFAFARQLRQEHQQLRASLD